MSTAARLPSFLSPHVSALRSLLLGRLSEGMPGHVHPMTGPPKWCWLQVVSATEEGATGGGGGANPPAAGAGELRCWLVSKRFARKRAGIEQRRAALLESGVSLDRNPRDAKKQKKKLGGGLCPCLRASAHPGDIFTPPRFAAGKAPYATVPLGDVRGIHVGRTTTNLVRTKKRVSLDLRHTYSPCPHAHLATSDRAFALC